MLLLVKLVARAVVFGVAVAFAARRVHGVKVDPPKSLPIVALVFAALNSFLYGFLALALNLATLWLAWFLVPFVANALLLFATDKLLGSFKIAGMVALAKTAGVVTAAHLLLRLVEAAW